MTEKKLSTLVINQVESLDVYNKLKAQGKINTDELYMISGEADQVSGVKGNKETTYRTGNINLTPEDIGALPDTTEIPIKVSELENDSGYAKSADLKTVAKTGSYNDLKDKPTIPTVPTAEIAANTAARHTHSNKDVLDNITGIVDMDHKNNPVNQSDIVPYEVFQAAANEILEAMPIVPTNVSAFTNDAGYLTQHQSLADYPKKTELATVATSGSYNDLSDTPTIPSVGNGTLTIQKNGTSAGTFTANATTDKTINIIVPTKVSELTDDVVSGKYLPLTGGTMTGNININNKTITNLKTPTASTEAANKKYVDDQIAANDHIVNRFTFTATANQSTFTIPFDFEDSSALTIYYNGIMMKETDNYTVSGKVITLAGFTAEAGDYLTVMGIEGAAAVDFGEEATNAINQMNKAKTETITEINNIKSQASTEIGTVKSNAIDEINNLVATLPSDTTNLMYKNKTNTMAANSKITMDSTYSPSANGDVATKKYVDDSKPSIVGTSTTYPIYIGSSTPASGTTPLLWIDTSSSGTFKYRTSTTGTWTAVPVAWS